MYLKKIFNFSSPLIVDIKVLSSLIILLLISVSINFNARLQEKKGWDENPSIFSTEGKTLVIAGDPAYYLNMLNSLRGEAEPICSGEDGLKSLELLIASYRSSETGSEIQLPLER